MIPANLSHPETIKALNLEYKQARANHRKLARQQKARDAANRDQSLYDNPHTV